MPLVDSIKSLFSSQPEDAKPDVPASLQKYLNRKNNKWSLEVPWNRINASKRIEAKEQHKAKFPWLFTDKDKGSRWDFDPVYLREKVNQDPVSQMAIENISGEASTIPWSIVEEGSGETAKSNPFERKSFGKQTEDEEIKQIFESPNSDEDLTEILEQIFADLLMVGSTSVVLLWDEKDITNDGGIRDGAKPVGMKVADPITFTKEYDSSGELQAFWQFQHNRFAGGSGTRGERIATEPIRFSVDEIVWSDINPRSWMRYGVPPSMMILPYLELQSLTIEQEQRYFDRGMIAPGALIFNDLSAAEVDELIEELEMNVKGDPGKLPMIGAGESSVEYLSFSFNYKELQYMERQQWYAKMVASAFRVPMSVIGLKPEDVNRATFEGERGNFESNALAPYLQKIERMFNKQIIQPFFDSKYRFEFQPGLSEKQRASISERVRTEFNQNLITRNEARQALGYEEVEEDGFADDVTETNEPAMFSFDEKGDGTPFRETGEWQVFELQPSDIEELKEKISGSLKEVWELILEDDTINEILERETPPSDDERKSVLDISRQIGSIINATDVIENIANVIEQDSEKIVGRTLRQTETQLDEDIDPDPILTRLKERKLDVVEPLTDRIEEQVRNTISTGWEEGLSIDKIKDNLSEKENEFTEYQAERLARDQLQRATGEARNEYAKQTDRVEVWITSGDNRVRDAHSEMEGKWKYPNEEFVVPYEDGDRKESYPGDSEKGIQCRCDTLLRRIEDVDDRDHAGV